jgi:ParB-like chromosome segregation protein Spo0J
MNGNGYKIEMRSIGAIKPYARNPRKNNGAVKAVAHSIEQFGFRQPIVVDFEGVIIAGHTRWKAAQRLGLTEVPVHVAADLTATQAKALRLADNKTHEFSNWDLELLPLELGELKELHFDISVFGFREEELKSAEIEVPQNIPEYLTFLVTSEERKKIERTLRKFDDDTLTKKLLALCASVK